MHKRRLLVDGARYHVTARANNKQMVMEADAMKELFIGVVSRARKKYAFSIDNFCIMGNHFHFIIKPHDGESLSRIMQWILSVYALSYHRLHGTCGHLWGERFFSRVINSFRIFMQIFKYIDENPIEAGIIEDKRAWIFSGGYFRRSGRLDFLSRLPAWLLAFYPDHFPLAITLGD
jgi:putative transposase